MSLHLRPSKEESKVGGKMRLPGGIGPGEEDLSGESRLPGENPKEGDLYLGLAGGERDLTGDRLRSIGCLLGENSKLNSATRKEGLNFPNSPRGRTECGFLKIFIFAIFMINQPFQKSKYSQIQYIVKFE